MNLKTSNTVQFQQMEVGSSSRYLVLPLQERSSKEIEADQSSYFKNEGQEIIIGRTPNCDIRIEDKLLSKTQAHIKFVDNNWRLFDGYNGKGSTNGTWIYLNDDFEMYDGMTFKANQTIFNVRIFN